MPLIDKRQRDRQLGSPPSSSAAGMIAPPVERDVKSCTAKDVAQLAGVSTATVSRVANGAGSVSADARTKVLAAMSTLRYRPNEHAAELRRGKSGSPRIGGNHQRTSSRAMPKVVSDPGVDSLNRRGQAG